MMLNPVQINDGVIVQQATEWSDELAQVALRKRISEAVGETQKAASVMEIADDRANLLGFEQCLGIAMPTFIVGVVRSGRRRNDEKPWTAGGQADWLSVVGAQDMEQPWMISATPANRVVMSLESNPV